MRGGIEYEVRIGGYLFVRQIHARSGAAALSKDLDPASDPPAGAQRMAIRGI